MNVVNNRLLNTIDASRVVVGKDGETAHQLGTLTPFNERQDVLTALKLISIRYRIKEHKKNEAAISPIEDLKSAFLEWKKGISKYENKEITPYNLKKLTELSAYDRFAGCLLLNKKIMDECFQLIFRDEFPIKILVQYFKICSIDLQECFLTKQVSVFHLHDKKILQIKKEEIDGKVYKDLQFKINNTFVSILNDTNKIETNNGIRTWKEIKEIWAKSKVHPAEMAIFETEGMMFYKPQGLVCFVDGKEVAIDTKKPFFWKDPAFPKFMTVSKDQLEKVLNCKIPEDKPYISTIQGSYIEPLYVDDSHGASFIYLLQDDGSYLWLPFGKYAKDFPINWWQKLLFVGNTVEGKFTYPDPTPFYRHRKHAIHFEFHDEEEINKLLTNYGKRVWQFQFPGNNCSKEWQLAFREVLGKQENYFTVPLLSAKFACPLNYIFGTISWIDKYISSRLAFWLVHLVHVIFFSFRSFSRVDEEGKKETASVYRELRHQQNLCVPGQLEREIKANNVKGVIYFGGELQFSNTALV